MTNGERHAIEQAIVRGIQAALDKVLVHPFPPNGTPRDQVFHATPAIQQAVRSELNQIRTTD